MATIPSSINGVHVDFAPSVVNAVTQNMLDGLHHTISPNVAPGYTLTSVWISSARDSHQPPSRHVTGQAADLSRFNGKFASTYPNDAEVRAFVQALQNRFESFQQRRENYGPFFLKKEGQDNPSAPPHQDHVHFSVN